MQRSQRRLVLSNDSESLASNLNLKVKRKRSKTPSAGGDYVNKVSKESCRGSNAKVKSRRKAHAKLVSRARAKKKIRLPKNQKPPIKSLQRAIVLAPFHTLKKCFQTRLINLYSYEKMKKINHKMKMAKKPNKSFEYDIIEIKPSIKKAIKKELTSSKIMHKSPKEKINKSDHSRSRSYCRCSKNNSEIEVKSTNNIPSEPKARKQRTRSSITKDSTSPEFLATSCFSAQGGSKKRKISSKPFSPTSLKTELSIPPLFKSDENFFSAGRSDLSISVVSSPSKAESWETYTDSLLPKDGYLQGSLAISTTSFDSFLEQFERDRLKCTDHTTSKSTPLKKNLDPNQKESTTVLVSPNDLLPRHNNNDSRHLIMAGLKPSEEGITDFMDREPQTQIIASVETSQHLHPLRRQSKTKEKNQNETDTAKTYALRSSEQRQEEIPLTESCSRNENRRLSQCSQRSIKITKLSKISSEVLTQSDDRSTKEKRSSPHVTKHSSGATVNGSAKYKDKTPIYLEGSSSDQVYAEYEMIEPKETPSKRQNISLEEEEGSRDKITSETDKMESKEDNESTNQSVDGFWMEDALEPTGLPEEQSEVSSIDIIPTSGNRNLDSHESCGDMRPPQEKDSCFIFGERNSSARMGESCEFSFGLNWSLSDDEDSSHGHRFF